MQKFILASVSSVWLLTGCSSTPPVLGVINGQLTPCPEKPNCVSSFAKDKAHYIAPIQHTGTALDIKNDIFNVLKNMPNSMATQTQDNYVRAEFTSKVFRFVDDVEFYFPDTETNNTTIHIRSASRVGHSDFGVNQERVEQIRSQLGKADKISN
ncbi:DUF1499 domain-containing protein [Paraglaciecola sp. 2405UD69-4]|uniref:DUF1499 domain-containing protein n=1 Tax=Paraglaciecola sp. 2405UD69-4 TaxID=3391836 RepID=UPI0039C91EA9